LKLPDVREIKHSFLRSKVARRIFLLFILCALIPLSALAYFSFSQVTKQLYSQAEKQLHQTSKASGMTIFERLLFLETDLEMISTSIQKGKTDILDTSSQDLRNRLKERFKGIVLITDRGRINPLFGGTYVRLQWSHDEQQHVNSGKTLVFTRHGTDKFSKIYMVKALKPAHSLQTFLLGEINPEYLWGGEGFLSTMTELFAFDQSNNLLFSSYSEYIPLQEMKSAIDKNPSSGRFTWIHGDNTYLANYWTVFMNPHFHMNWIMVQNQSKADILSPISTFKKIFLLLVILTFFIVLLLSFRQIRRNLVPIELLREATRRIAAKDFKKQIQIKTNDEFEELGAAFNEMTASLDNHFQIMTTLNRIGIALSAEKNNKHLLELILLSAKNIINADGCALYTLNEDKQLQLSVMQIDSINLIRDGTDGISIPLYDQEGNSNTSIVAAYSVLKDKTVNVPDIYTAGAFDFSGNRDFDRQIGYKSQSFLSVLLKNHENEILGVLQLINAQNRLSNEVIPFSDEDQRLLETIASQAAVALSKNILIEDFKELFDSLVELIATAIDEKSPYTGDHCRRVPELTMMLAEAVSRSGVGNLKDFELSEEERYELKIAALLHDCGKVTTPVHVADKATRLETIFDRIHVIDTRFEILKRDTQIAALQNRSSALLNRHEGDLSSLEKEKQKTMQQIEDDRNFVLTCNNGDIFMDDNRKERLRDIASRYKWINTKGVEEPIISDEEVYMLTTAQGTITPDERVIINKHVETTSKMLGSLHYPKSLRNVPIFAQAHHERMDGKGYPKGLMGEQIPIQSRIIAIADIFEALTAKTRPYKKGKTLTEALFVLGSMRQNGHIDPDIFDVFISEKVYLRYAAKYLSKEQIDEIVLSEIPGYSLQHSN
jgi:HD-GYP domain-containing protein (c-di-GMP phosphodiesterase class II)/HAMP domain-containing protein